MNVIENKNDKNLKTKDVLIPILLVLACLAVPFMLVVLSVLMADAELSAFAFVVLLIFVGLTTALVLYIREKKCFKLVKSLLLEVFYGLAFSSSFNGGNKGNWKIGLLLFILYIVFGFYRIFKLGVECDLENKKWYNKWWFRIILVLVAGLLLGVLASFFTVHCATHSGFLCNLFTRLMSDINN